MRIKRLYGGFFALASLFALLFPLSGGARSVNLDIRPGAGVTERKRISDYLPSLKGTHFDTPVFILDSGKPGVNALIIGGTHANEMAGYLSAMLFVENAVVRRGRLVVIPFANRSAISIPDARSLIPHRHVFSSRSGQRVILYGNRFTDPEDQPGTSLSKGIGKRRSSRSGRTDGRNLNRLYPGDPEGSPTQRLAYAITRLVLSDRFDFCLDFHEARTPQKRKRASRRGSSYNSRLSYSLVSHPRGLEIAAFALLAMEESTGISLKLEESKPTHKGLSHWEIGTLSRCISFLSESPNPGQDRWRRHPDVIHDADYPLRHRVGIHIQLFFHLMEAYSDAMEKPFAITGVPLYEELMRQGVGPFLN